ncbi:MAG TPA: DUF3499 family protein [Actinomycetota bacterium]|nr:DUF3499 family protein [Actinomycetota bacterium]
MNLCSKPGCTRAGAALLGYDYAARRAVLDDPPDAGEVSPHVYVLCSPCAERIRPPRGWLLDDLRVEPPLFVAAERCPPGEPRAAGSSADDDAARRRQLSFG